MKEVPMSCAAVTVNRSLILLAIAWGVIPVAVFQAVTMTGQDDAVAVHSGWEPEPGSDTLSSPLSEPPPCKLDHTAGLLPALSMAITQPNRKNASVTNGR
ncbi:hypothetical protein [Hyalangium minutum]|uniref:hypothetical protein n=1 Tax=Hyalangium minutum TaxID=394096 RepID=UPI0005C5EEF7|nr:hypothetical protein [Hyalangium minutum]